MTANTRKSDTEILIQFAHDQGFDILDVMQAANRLENAIKADLTDYSFPVQDEDQP